MSYYLDVMNLRYLLKTAIKVYVFTCILIFLVIGIFMYRSGTSLTGIFGRLYEVSTNKSFLVFLHLVFLGFFLLFLLLRYIWRGYRSLGWKTALKRLSLFVLLPSGLLYGARKTIIAVNTTENYDYAWNYDFENVLKTPQKNYLKDGKHRGMSVFRLGGGEHRESMQALIKDNVEWVAVIPFLYQENEQTKQLRSRASEKERTKSDSLMMRRIDTLHAQGMYVHLKPHVWLGDGWRSNIRLAEEDWDHWFAVYEKEMLYYARIAEATGAGLFCIGTELRTVIANRPDAWKPFIAKIKSVYSGKLTYAANWDDPLENIPFWEEMDYIGVQAYFPLTDHELPEIESIKTGWEKHITMLESASERYKKPVLFTEIGYRSDASATIKPWEWGSRLGALYNKKSDRTQQFAYEALFQTLWDKDWFSGCYIWQWHANTNAASLKDDVDFTPRFKPAENTIAQWYGQVGKTTLGFD